MDKVRKFCETRGFRVLDYKGAGSYGQVFYVESQATRLRYVGKICRIAGAYTQVNFWREADLQKKMSSKYVVKLYEASFNEIENFGLLVMEACDCSLESYVSKLKGKVLPEGTLRDVCHDVCHAIVYLHGVRVAHRDIKPANILVCNSKLPGRRPTYKLCDFGCAKENKPNDGLKTVYGSPAFMAREVFSGSYDVEVDCWGLGVTAYLLATHTLPYKSTKREGVLDELFNDGNESYSLPPTAPVGKECRDFVNKLLTKSSHNRLHTKDLLSHPFIACKRRTINFCIVRDLPGTHGEVLDHIASAEAPFEPEALFDGITWGTMLSRDLYGLDGGDAYVVSDAGPGGISSLGDLFPWADADLSCFVVSKESLHVLRQGAEPAPFFGDSEAGELVKRLADYGIITEATAVAMDRYCLRHADYVRKALIFRTLAMQMRRSLAAYVASLFAFATRVERCMRRPDDAAVEVRYHVEPLDPAAERAQAERGRRCEDLVCAFCNPGYEAEFRRVQVEAFASRSRNPTAVIRERMGPAAELFRKTFLDTGFVRSELVEFPLSYWNLMCERILPLVRTDIPWDLKTLFMRDDVEEAVAELRRTADAFVAAKDDLQKLGITVCKKTYLLVEKSDGK